MCRFLHSVLFNRLTQAKTKYFTDICNDPTKVKLNVNLIKLICRLPSVKTIQLRRTFSLCSCFHRDHQRHQVFKARQYMDPMRSKLICSWSPSQRLSLFRQYISPTVYLPARKLSFSSSLESKYKFSVHSLSPTKKKKRKAKLKTGG